MTAAGAGVTAIAVAGPFGSAARGDPTAFSTTASRPALERLPRLDDRIDQQAWFLMTGELRELD